MHFCLSEWIMFQVVGLGKNMQQPFSETSSLTLMRLIQLSLDDSSLHMHQVRSNSVCFKPF